MTGRSSRSNPATLREQLAQEAARLMMENGIEDYGLAKRKAAERLGVRSAGALPSNAEVEESLAERQRLFEPETHVPRLEALRRIAADVMELLEPFEPRLVGPVLAGTATETSPIEIHVYTEAPEHIVYALEERQIAWRDCQRRYRFRPAEQPTSVPGYTFTCDGAEVVVVAFGERRSRQAPLSPVDQRPMKRASRADVLALLA